MSYVMLPNSSRAIPTTDAERAAAEENAEQPAFGSRATDWQDLPDEPGAEMAKEVRVWRTYVRETDRWDKEMVEGRNNSLDVLLIFAALFSAISTAFIIESLGDLKPDPAESSAQTLLVISQQLATIANGQPASALAQGLPSSVTFSPSRSSVVVNVLWPLSLSLSVAVSLVAMLAKEWCYKFMSGRSGQIYDQARRRQRRWNGIERWKMKELLTYLPGMMHLALVLFAAGLSVYLWDINVSVAIPVVAVTVATTLVYLCATILPALDAYCPYTTPLTTVCVQVFRGLHGSVRGGALLALTAFRSKVRRLRGLQLVPETMMDPLQIESHLFRSESPSSGNTQVPMDIVTSQMLAWLMANCDDPRSVDTAVQAIAGANGDLPSRPLAQCGVLGVLTQRFRSYVRWDRRLENYCVKEPSMLPLALGCCRAYRVLVFENPSSSTQDNQPDVPDANGGELGYMGTVLEYSGIIAQAMDLSIDSNLVAIASAACMPLLRQEVGSNLWSREYDSISQSVASLLERHVQTNNTLLSELTLRALVESIAHWLIVPWPEEQWKHSSQSSLFILVAQVFLAYRKVAPEVAWAAAVTLAATAFAVGHYPGGERPSRNDGVCLERAAQVLQFYQDNQPIEDTMSLFMFGFIGLLP